MESPRFEVPEGALPGQFCKYHIKTIENPEGTDCTANLAEGVVHPCGYKSPEQAQNGREYYVGASIVPRVVLCPNYSPRTYGPDSDFGKSLQQELVKS